MAGNYIDSDMRNDLTEEEAVERWCPHALVVIRDADDGSVSPAAAVSRDEVIQ